MSNSRVVDSFIRQFSFSFFLSSNEQQENKAQTKSIHQLEKEETLFNERRTNTKFELSPDSFQFQIVGFLKEEEEEKSSK